MALKPLQFSVKDANSYLGTRKDEQGHYLRVVSAPAGAALTFQFDGKDEIPYIPGETRRTPRTAWKYVEVKSSVPGTVLCIIGSEPEDRETTQPNFGVDPSGATGDIVQATPLQVGSGQTRTVNAQGYGTAILNITVPNTGTSTLSDIQGNTIPYRYLDGRVESRGNLVPGFSGLIIIDLAGFGGFKISHFGPGVVTLLYDIAAPTHPYWLKRQIQEGFNTFAVGGVPFAGGQKLRTNVYNNFGTKSLSIFGQFNGGLPGEAVIFSVQPVDLAGNVYGGRPWYFSIPLNGGLPNPQFFVHFDMEGNASYADVEGLANGQFAGPAPLPIGAADFLIQLENQGATAWGVQDLQIYQKRG